MAAEEVVQMISDELSRQEYRLEDKNALNSLRSILESFDTDLLMYANKRTDGELFRMFSQVVIDASEHRRQKFLDQKNLRVSASDFVPAFAIFDFFPPFEPHWLPRRRPIRRGIMGDAWDFIRKSCPWC